jgi:hypothetical protein
MGTVNENITVDQITAVRKLYKYLSSQDNNEVLKTA